MHNEVILDKIQLLVIDTANFPKGVFMRDLDLMRPFLSVDQNVRNFEDFRRRKGSEFSGYYYFGEYLSQGALKVKGHCQIVSARNIVGGGLYDIRKEFKEFANWERGPGSARWANAVLEMREVFYRNKSQRCGMSKRALLAALQISDQFGPDFQAPMAASLAALAAPLNHDVFTLSVHAMRSPSAAFNRERFLEELARISACDTMPEVQEYGSFMRGIYKDHLKHTVAAKKTMFKSVGLIHIMG
ncbi:hypothetical protein J3F84DRAFT_374983 [Trichoderma pleuroticola]